MAGARLVFNVAGVNTLCPADRDVLYQTNVGGAEAVVRAAARPGVGRVVHTSSAAALGEAAGAVGREDSPPRGWFFSHYELFQDHRERPGPAAARAVGSGARC